MVGIDVGSCEEVGEGRGRVSVSGSSNGLGDGDNLFSKLDESVAETGFGGAEASGIIGEGVWAKIKAVLLSRSDNISRILSNIFENFFLGNFKVFFIIVRISPDN